MVVVAEATVVVFGVAPTQEQALEYLRLPEQAEAYVGMAVGTAVTGLADAIDVSKELAGFVGNAVEMTVVAKIVL